MPQGFLKIILFLSLLVFGSELYAQASCRCSNLVKLCNPIPASAAIKRKISKKCTKQQYQNCGIYSDLNLQIDHNKNWENKEPLFKGWWPNKKANGSSLNHWLMNKSANLFSSERKKNSEEQTERFMRAIEENRGQIMSLYKNKLTKEQYNKFALAAMGILGAESTFYKSPRYKIKKETPTRSLRLAKCLKRGWCLNVFGGLAKCYNKKKKNDDLGPYLFLCMQQSSRWSDDLSNGPTQIKKIPQIVRKKYKMSPRSLFENPQHAALATIAFLIELKDYAFRLKKKYKKSMASMSKDNYIDHLIYLYQGKGQKIIHGEVPSTKKNKYLQRFHQALSAVAIKRYSCEGTDTGKQTNQVIH